MASAELRELTLQDVGGGACVELFERELQTVLRNINDPNTDPEATRKILIEVVFKPAKNREAAAVIVKVGSKVAGVEPVGTVVHLARQQGKYVALMNNPNQEDLPFGVVAGTVGGEE